MGLARDVSGSAISEAVIDHVVSRRESPGEPPMLHVVVRVANTAGMPLRIGKGLIQAGSAERQFNELGIELQPDHNVQFCFDFPLEHETRTVTVHTHVEPGYERTTVHDLKSGETKELVLRDAHALQLPSAPLRPYVQRGPDKIAILFATLALAMVAGIVYLLMQPPTNTEAQRAVVVSAPVSVEVEAIPVPPETLPLPVMPESSGAQTKKVRHWGSKAAVEKHAVSARPRLPAPQAQPAQNQLAGAGHAQAATPREQRPSSPGEAYLLRTYTSDNGQLLELDALPNKDPGKVTVTQLRDGVVTASYPRKH